MLAQQNAATLPNERTVRITRVFDAPRDLVFKLWTDPKHMAQWWGPQGFDNPVCEIDARVGGTMRIHMRQQSTGAVYPMTATFSEVMPPERLAFVAYAEDLAGKRQLECPTVVLFEDVGGKTRLTVHAKGVALDPVGPQMLAGMEEGWTQSLVRLGELVQKL